MNKRVKLSSRKSKRMFSRNALKTNVRNVSSTPMRGGIRL